MIELLQQAGKTVSQWRRTMILSHARPDGDSLGAMGAMARVILAQGREATPFVYEPLLPRYQFLKVAGSFHTWPADAGGLNEQFDGIVILDTCSWSQLEPAAEFLRGSRLPRVIVDHHATRDELHAQGGEALYVVDPTSASACGLLYEWCEVMGWRIDDAAGEALLVGITTDTGWFRFSNTDGRTLRAAAALIEAGIAPHFLYSELYETRTAARLRLKALVLATLELHAGDAVTVMSLTKSMLDRAGATPGDSEELVNEPMETGSVCVSVLLTDLGDGKVRANLRSKAPEVCGRDVDVAEIAKQLGGGGHRRAAGAWLTGSLELARQTLLPVVVEALK